MTEAEAIESLTNIGEIAATYAGLWVSITFGYLTVAYFLGASLSRFQCWVISTLYAVFAVLFSSTTLGYVDSWLRLRRRESTVFDDVWLFSEIPYYFEFAGFILVASTIVSLYFMYNVRSKRET